MKRIVVFSLLAGCVALAADDTTGMMFDQQLTSAQKEIVPLVEAMPDDQMNFAPASGEFKGVRSFSLQAMHVGAVLYMVSAGILGEKVPIDVGTSENGPAAMTSKAEVVKYLNDAFVYAHKAMTSLTAQNLTASVKSPFGGGETQRGSLAVINVSHVLDHYGQMAVYARMKDRASGEPTVTLPGTYC